MSKLQLSLAIGDYDRTRPLSDGSVQIDGVDPVILTLSPEEIFFRAFRHAEFDVCELSLSSFAVRTCRGDNPYVGVPAFPSRAFRHGSIYVRSDRGIHAPADLRGRRVGVPEYQLTALVWARALLEEDFGVKPAEIRWLRGGLEQPGRIEKVPFAPPGDIRIEDAPEGASLSALLEAGEIDGIISPRAPSCYDRSHPHVARLFADPVRAATEYFERTRIFPIMHLVGIRRELAARHPWLPASVLKAFEQAKSLCLGRMADSSAAKVTLPFAEEQLKAARDLMGSDFWSYGIEANRAVLESFLGHHHAQGLSPRRVAVEELFHPATFETTKV
jgi:4,5-dihydroxyphthalate decarboxylase